ncbi:MAG: PilZ domain-containing protein [Desulfotignum sp.]
MTDNFTDNPKKESRSEPRIPASEGAIISFKPPGSEWEYNIKLRDFSTSGLGLLVKEDSDLLKYIRVGDVFAVNYHEDGVSMARVRHHKVQVRHISVPAAGKPENHMVVGLSFLVHNEES